MRALVTLALMLLMAGCTVGPDYARPPLDVPQTFANADRDANQTANIDWWRQYGDPELDALIAEALAGNRDMAVAAANIEQAAAVFTQSRSPLFPQIGYGGTATEERASETDAPLLYSVIDNPKSSFQTWPARTGRSTSGAASGGSRRPPGPSSWPPRRPGRA